MSSLVCLADPPVPVSESAWKSPFYVKNEETRSFLLNLLLSLRPEFCSQTEGQGCCSFSSKWTPGLHLFWITLCLSSHNKSSRISSVPGGREGKAETPVHSTNKQIRTDWVGEGAPTLQPPHSIPAPGAGQEQSSKVKPRALLLPTALRAVFLQS